MTKLDNRNQKPGNSGPSSARRSGVDGPRRLLILSLCLLPTLLAAQTPPALLTTAEQALASNLPQVAVQKLQTLLASPDVTDDSLRQRAGHDLTHALLDSGDAAGALARLDFPSGDEERLWKAEALSALGRWDDAEPLFEEVAAYGPSALSRSATIGQAEALHALGRLDEAAAALSALNAREPSTVVQLRLAELYLEEGQVEPARRLLASAKPLTLVENRWREYVEGRLFLDEDQPAPALQDFQELLGNPRGLTPALQAGATFGLTDARIVLNGLEVADNVLEDFIGHNPDSPYLEAMFRRLDQLYAQEENPSDSVLKFWVYHAPPRVAALALYYEARTFRRQSRLERAAGAFTDFIQRYPAHPLAFEAWMQIGQLYLDTGRTSAAISAFESAMRSSVTPVQRARGEIAAGNASFAQGDFLLATEHFHNAADRCPEVWLQATYNSALAWLHVGNYDRFLADYTSLSQRYPDTPERRDLLLEEGLLQARSGDPRAIATLQSFVRDFPDNRRVAEASVALAELVFADGDTNSASHLLQAAYVQAPSNQSREQADYLAIFIADSAPNRQDSQVLRLGLQFLDHYPASSLRPQVRMKLGQVYFRRQDFANAQTQFETLAQENPGDSLADNALILAGQSSVSGMSPGGNEHALALFDRVANGSGPLHLYARQEQALLKVRMGLNKDAIILYDDILRSSPDTSLRLASLCGKADCLVATAGDSPAPSTPLASSTDPSAQAVALYDQIAADPDATPPWRDQALFQKGRCLSKQGLADAALTAFYDVLNNRSTAAGQQPDFFWFEKAGFEAASMLEAKSQWPSAISILEKVAQAGGPRSAEARHHADQLRLEHFVWD